MAFGTTFRTKNQGKNLVFTKGIEPNGETPYWSESFEKERHRPKLDQVAVVMITDDTISKDTPVSYVVAEDNRIYRPFSSNFPGNMEHGGVVEVPLGEFADCLSDWYGRPVVANEVLPRFPNSNESQRVFQFYTVRGANGREIPCELSDEIDATWS